jgi:hypothetical protein
VHADRRERAAVMGATDRDKAPKDESGERRTRL